MKISKLMKFMDTRYMNQSRVNTEKPKVDNKPLYKDEEQLESNQRKWNITNKKTMIGLMFNFSSESMEDRKTGANIFKILEG